MTIFYECEFDADSDGIYNSLTVSENQNETQTDW